MEEHRLRLLEEAKEVSRVKLDMDMRMREYNKANGFTSVTPRVAVAAKDREKGKNLSKEFARVAESGTKETSISGSYTSSLAPKYDTPAKNMRAALAAAEELPNLTGDALLKQQTRVTQLLATANRQDQKMMRKTGVAGASQV